MLPEQEENLLKVLDENGIQKEVLSFQSVLPGGIINKQGNEIYAKELTLCLKDYGFTLSYEYEYKNLPRVLSPSIPRILEPGHPSLGYGYIDKGTITC